MKATSKPNSINSQYEEELRNKILFWTFVLFMFAPTFISMPMISAGVSFVAGWRFGWKVGGEKNMPFARRLWHSAKCAFSSAAVSSAIFAGLVLGGAAVMALSTAIISGPVFIVGMVAMAALVTYAQGKLGAKATLWATNRLNKKAPVYPAPKPQLTSPGKNHHKAHQVTEPEKPRSLLLKIASVLAKPVEWIVGKPVPTPASNPENPKLHSPAPPGTATPPTVAIPSTTAATPSKAQPSALSNIKLPTPILNGLRLISAGVSKLVPSFMRRSDKGGGRGDASV